MIPTVDITRGSQQLTAEMKSPVDWGDSVQTQADGRARLALDDGSVLNVGADSTFQVTQHNPGEQQTQVDLTYGRIRSKVVHLSRPNAKFEVHTPVGVAGVVGTDFYIFYENRMMQLVVFEGHVHFCNLAGLAWKSSRDRPLRFAPTMTPTPPTRPRTPRPPKPPRAHRSRARLWATTRRFPTT